MVLHCGHIAVFFGGGLAEVFWQKDQDVLELALTRLGEVTPDAAEYGQAAKDLDPEEVGPVGRRVRKRPAVAEPEAEAASNQGSEPCTAANDSP